MTKDQARPGRGLVLAWTAAHTLGLAVGLGGALKYGAFVSSRPPAATYEALAWRYLIDGVIVVTLVGGALGVAQSIVLSSRISAAQWILASAAAAPVAACLLLLVGFTADRLGVGPRASLRGPIIVGSAEVQPSYPPVQPAAPFPSTDRPPAGAAYPVPGASQPYPRPVYPPRVVPLDALPRPTARAHAHRPARRRRPSQPAHAAAHRSPP